MGTPEYNLLIALALIPVVIGMQVWVKKRRLGRRHLAVHQHQQLSGTVEAALEVVGHCMLAEELHHRAAPA